jgi:hypothetical protein
MPGLAARAVRRCAPTANRMLFAIGDPSHGARCSCITARACPPLARYAQGAATHECRSNSRPNITSDKAATPAFRTFVVARPAAEPEPPAAADERPAAVRAAEAREPPAVAAEAHEPPGVGARGHELPAGAEARGSPAAGAQAGEPPAMVARGREPPSAQDEAQEAPPQAPQERALLQEPDEAQTAAEAPERPQARGREPLGVVEPERVEPRSAVVLRDSASAPG